MVSRGDSFCPRRGVTHGISDERIKNGEGAREQKDLSRQKTETSRKHFLSDAKIWIAKTRTLGGRGRRSQRKIVKSNQSAQ